MHLCNFQKGRKVLIVVIMMAFQKMPCKGWLKVGKNHGITTRMAVTSRDPSPEQGQCRI